MEQWTRSKHALALVVCGQKLCRCSLWNRGGTQRLRGKHKTEYIGSGSTSQSGYTVNSSILLVGENKFWIHFVIWVKLQGCEIHNREHSGGKDSEASKKEGTCF